MDVAVQPVTVEWMGTRYRILLTDSNPGSAGVFESFDQPGYGPPRHIHNAEDETFYVLSGSVEFWMGGMTTRHGAGDLVFVPRGVEHAFRIAGNSAARMLTILTPGGFERFFVEMARKSLRIPDDMRAISEVAERYHLTFTGPPLGAH